MNFGSIGPGEIVMMLVVWIIPFAVTLAITIYVVVTLVGIRRATERIARAAEAAAAQQGAVSP
jgi:sorbitol-specific phosphotransferase system component IIC